MLPLRDTIPTKNYPVVNTTLIAVNVFLFIYQASRGLATDSFLFHFGLVPAKFSNPELAAFFSPGQKVFSFFSFMFLHGGFLHLLGNMWTLYIFGDNVEDRLGHLRYLVFYLACGILSGFVHMAFNLDSQTPTIGASGAIAGVMGAYFLLYPFSKILTLIPILFIPWIVEIPAFFFLGLWLLLQVINAAVSHTQITGIAWWAHIGGFVFGIVLLKMFLNVSWPVFERINRLTEKKKTSHLQVIRPTGPGDDYNLHGTLVVTPYEALTGTHKLVNVPWGFHNRMFKVTVPPQTREGSLLRLKGLGKFSPDKEERGDLLLKVEMRS